MAREQIDYLGVFQESVEGGLRVVVTEVVRSGENLDLLYPYSLVMEGKPKISSQA